jgi:dTDP-4-dehydrorhamnose 3,5-epimerase
MIFVKTPLLGGYLVGLEPNSDERGMFARAFCAREFETNSLETSFVQVNISTNKVVGTVRGMHFQREPHDEVKLIRCVKGSIYDVIVDLRKQSPTYLRWFGTELSEENGLMMYVPKGFAHGYQSLTEGATTLYMVSAYYAPHSESGCRFDDPRLAIRWPVEVTSISSKDARWPLLSQ